MPKTKHKKHQNKKKLMKIPQKTKQKTNISKWAWWCNPWNPSYLGGEGRRTVCLRSAQVKEGDPT
jgi:hypothetical protein